MIFQVIMPRNFYPKIYVMLIAVLFGFSLPAWAELGANVTSVQDDQAKLKGSLKVTSAANYQIHEIKTEQGTTVREYVSPGGTVFGVSWQGQFTPDLRQLLGSYFSEYMQAAAQARKTSRGPVTIQTSDLVVQRGGHMRFLVGRAYLPQMVPQGVSADEIK